MIEMVITKVSPPKAVAGWCVASKAKKAIAPMIAQMSQSWGKLGKSDLLIIERGYHAIRTLSITIKVRLALDCVECLRRIYSYLEGKRCLDGLQYHFSKIYMCSSFSWGATHLMYLRGTLA